MVRSAQPEPAAAGSAAAGSAAADSVAADSVAAESARTEPDRPGETEAQRDDRNTMELLNELRVAGLGVQVLFGFLLSLPFTNRFSELNHAQRGLYLASVLLAALSTALLVGPVAYHRLLFRRHQKGSLVKVANVMAVAGLVTVGLAISSAVLLVVSFVSPGWPAVVITAIAGCAFAGLWFALPLARRDRQDHDDREVTAVPEGSGRPGDAGKETLPGQAPPR
jgi:hypothetical protein